MKLLCEENQRLRHELFALFEDLERESDRCAAVEWKWIGHGASVGLL